MVRSANSTNATTNSRLADTVQFIDPPFPDNVAHFQGFTCDSMRLSHILAALGNALLVAANQTIINGTEAGPREYPFIVSLQQVQQFFSLDPDEILSGKVSDYVHTCGRTLINRQQFITAAHCFDLCSWIPGMAAAQRVRVGSERWAEGGYFSMSVRSICTRNGTGTAS